MTAPQLSVSNRKPKVGELNSHLQILAIVERLSRLKITLIRNELRRRQIDGLSGAHALILFAIGCSGATPSDIAARGFYQGTSLRHCVKTLAKDGYLTEEPCEIDRRAKKLYLTEKGAEIADVVAEMYERQNREVERQIGKEPRGKLLMQLEKFESVLRYYA